MPRNFIKNIRNNEFIGNVLTLFSGSVIAHLVPLAVLPVITRLYNPDIIGVFFLYSSTAFIISGFSTLRYDLAVVLPKRDKDAWNLLTVGIFVVLIMGFLFFFITFLLDEEITALLDTSLIKNWLLLIPVSVILLGITQLFIYWNNRKKNYKLISIVKILKTSTIGITQIVLGLLHFTKSGLIAGLVTGQFIATAFISVKGLISNRKKIHEVSWVKSRYLIKKYKNMPIYNSFIAVINTFANHLPIFLLTAFYNVHEAALYGLADKIISTPMGLTGQSIAHVFYQKASEYYNEKKNIHEFVKKMYRSLAKMAVLPFAAAAVASPLLFKYIFGMTYENSGYIVLILIPWLFVRFLNIPPTMLINVLNKQKILLLYNIFMLLFRILALYAGYFLYNDVFISLILYSFTGLVFSLLLMFYILNLSKKFSRQAP